MAGMMESESAVLYDLRRTEKRGSDLNRELQHNGSFDDLRCEDVEVRPAADALESTCDQRDIYLSLVWHGGKLAVAYYDLDSPQVSFMADTPETADFALLKQVIKQIEPTTVILSSKQDDRLLKVLRQTMSNCEDSETMSEQDYQNLVFLPNCDFEFESCKRRILLLSLPGLQKQCSETERMLFYSSVLPLDQFCVVKAVGGLLKYLSQARVGVELEHSSINVPVLGFHEFTADDQIIIDETTYSALQIFHKETHPSVYKFGTSCCSKEGLSLFGIMNKCKSQMGSKRLRLWFFRPLKDLKVLHSRLDAVAYLSQAGNTEILKSLQSCVKNIKNVARILMRMIEAEALMSDWMALYKTVYHALCIGDICRGQSLQVDIFRQITNKFTTSELYRIASVLHRTLDFESSPEGIMGGNTGFMVKPGLDEELDSKKRTYYGLPDLMTKVAREELSRLGENITTCNVIYMPQICYLLAIPKPEGMKDENYDMPGLKYMLDFVLGDTLCDIKDMEKKILLRLQNDIVEHSAVLLDVVELSAELDCLLSLTSCALEFGYVKPALTESSVIDIQKGRHPLQELCCSPFIPNNTQSGGVHSKVKVLTGPNACGKSVYLKQVALIVYMAHIGSFVPAEHAVIGQVDQIFSRIRSIDSISVGLSTFMLDINQMADALNNATMRSLVVVDEFGKGTETVDGLSLLTSSLRYWLKKGEGSPHVLVSTHFHELLQQPLLPVSPLLEFLTMETLQEDGQLVFLYHLIAGQASSSYAAHAALKAGLPPDIVQRGKQVSTLLSQYKPVHPVDDSADAQLRRYQKIVGKFLELDLQTCDVKGFLQKYVLPISLGHNATWPSP